MMIILYAVATAAVLWLLADFIFAKLMHRRWHRWESEQERGPDGVRQGNEAFTLGDGDVAMLLVHGFADSPDLWRNHMAPVFAEMGYTCRAVRLPIFNEPINAEHGCWRETVRKELAELREKHDKVVVVAHSLGCAVSMNVLTEEGLSADAFISLAPLDRVSDHRSPLLPARGWHNILDPLIIFSQTIVLPFPPDIADDEEREKMRLDQFVPRKVFREMYAVLDDNRGREKHLDIPTMMVISRSDIIVDYRASEQRFEKLASPNKKLVYHDEAAHVIPRDNGWRKVADDIHEFVKEVTGL
jgi:esterase/lipase